MNCFHFGVSPAIIFFFPDEINISTSSYSVAVSNNLIKAQEGALRAFLLKSSNCYHFFFVTANNCACYERDRQLMNMGWEDQQTVNGGSKVMSHIYSLHKVNGAWLR